MIDLLAQIDLFETYVQNLFTDISSLQFQRIPIEL